VDSDFWLCIVAMEPNYLTLALLGSKTLGTNVLEFQFIYVGKP